MHRPDLCRGDPVSGSKLVVFSGLDLGSRERVKTPQRERITVGDPVLDPSDVCALVCTLPASPLDGKTPCGHFDSGGRWDGLTPRPLFTGQGDRWSRVGSRLGVTVSAPHNRISSKRSESLRLAWACCRVGAGSGGPARTPPPVSDSSPTGVPRKISGLRVLTSTSRPPIVRDSGSCTDGLGTGPALHLEVHGEGLVGPSPRRALRESSDVRVTSTHPDPPGSGRRLLVRDGPTLSPGPISS